jgi:hypothetical protein
MHIVIRLSSSRLRSSDIALAEQLETTSGARVVIEITEAASLPAEVEALLALERILYPRNVSYSGRKSDEFAPLDKLVDFAIDFSGDESWPTETRAVRPLYDGVAGEDELIGSLLHHHVPIVTLQREDGRIVAEALPSMEGSRGLSGAMEAVFSRVNLLLVAYVKDGRERRIGAVGGLPDPERGQVKLRTFDALRYGAKALARRAALAIHDLCVYAPHWRIGWRFNEGRDVFDRASLEGPTWRVLPDPGRHFYADPFPVRWQGRNAIFFEDLDYRTGKGMISVVAFDETGPTGPAQPVLKEAWHLSYPFVFAHAGQLWMVPESSTNQEVALYRCAEFPLRWERHATLLTDVEAADATLLRHNGLWWMMAATRPREGGYSDTLSLYHASALEGPWRPHPGNPVLIDSRCARPAGRVFKRAGRWLRPAQDCSTSYGAGLALGEITRLDVEGFEQTIKKIIKPGALWPGRKIHTFNRCGPLEVIDGAVMNPKFAAARPWF